MIVPTCNCTESACGHTPGQPCGKPINLDLAKSHRQTDASGKESGGWICDACYERVRPDKSR